MKRRKTDDRISLWDLQISRIQIEGRAYQLEGEPERGASCLVYRAKRCFRIGEKEHEQKVLLKEFYPLLNPDQGAGIHRGKDGRLMIPEATKASSDYQKYLDQFHNAVSIMLEMGNSGMGADHGVIPLSVMEAYGTWYVEEIDDSGRAFTEVFYKVKKQLYAEDEGGYSKEFMKEICEQDGVECEYEAMNYHFQFFLEFYKKAMWSLKRLHGMGYFHLDYTPKNLSLTSGGNVKLFDTDTFVKEEELGRVRPERYTEGYAAPELVNVICHGGDPTVLIGPWTDIYSMTQVLCWYLYGYPLDDLDMEEELESLEEKIQDTFGFWKPQLNPMGVQRLKTFIRKNLSVDYELRCPSVEMAYMEISTIQYEMFEAEDEDRNLQEEIFDGRKKDSDLPKETQAARDEIAELQAIAKSLQQDETFVSWSWGRALLRFVAGLALITGGGTLVAKAAYLMSYLGEIAAVGISLHLVGNGMIVAGVFLAMYCFYEYWVPHDLWQFAREYFYPILATIAAVFAYTFPPFFAYRNGFAPSMWKTIDFLQNIVETGICGGGGVLLFSWFHAMKDRRRRGGRWLITISLLLFILSLVHIFALIRCGGV